MSNQTSSTSPRFVEYSPSLLKIINGKDDRSYADSHDGMTACIKAYHRVMRRRVSALLGKGRLTSQEAKKTDECHDLRTRKRRYEETLAKGEPMIYRCRVGHRDQLLYDVETYLTNLSLPDEVCEAIAERVMGAPWSVRVPPRVPVRPVVDVEDGDSSRSRVEVQSIAPNVATNPLHEEIKTGATNIVDE
jgi:hypothetical protein